MIDLDITELFEEIVKELPEGLEILYPNGKGGTKVEVPKVELHLR